MWLAKCLPYWFKALELDFMEFLSKKLALRQVKHRLCKYEKFFRLAIRGSQRGGELPGQAVAQQQTVQPLQGRRQLRGGDLGLGPLWILLEG